MAITIHDFELPYLTHNEYNVNFYDDVVHTLVTHDPTKVSEWISSIESTTTTANTRLLVGIDVEWRPNNRFQVNPVATLQLCVDHRCLIFQILYCPKDQIPRKLFDFLNNPNNTFAGVGVDNDVEKLIEDYDMRVGNVVDLGKLAANVYGDNGLKNAGLKGLSKFVLGKEVEKPKSVTLSTWNQEWLTPPQVQYACIDAFLSSQIGRILEEIKNREDECLTSDISIRQLDIGHQHPSARHRTSASVSLTSDISIRQLDIGQDEDEYVVDFSGDAIRTLVTACPSEVADWISTIQYIHRNRLGYLIVGLDVEWRPNNRFYKNPVATLQLCVGRRCLIFQLLYCDEFPQELLDFLADPDYTFVGVGVERDVIKLEEDYGIEVGGRIVDLRALAADRYGDDSLMNASLKMLVDAVLEVEIDKPRWVTRSRWDHRWLTLDQIQYACVDAYASFEMGRVLNAYDD